MDQTSEAQLMRFRAGETLSDAISRVSTEQFDVALGIADAAPADRSLAVHATRKALKRLRAVVRMVRDVIRDGRYDTDNQALKLVAAELSGVRDTWVMAQTLARILPRNPETGEALPVLMARLQTQYQAESQAVLGNDAQMAAIVEQLERIKQRSRGWSVLAGVETPLPHSFDSLRPGLERVYERGRRGMAIVQESPTDTLLHVWRKRAKYLRHQIEALNILDPVTLLDLEGRLERLTDLLGDDHDLAVLTNRVNEDSSLRMGVDVAPVLEAIGTHRHELQVEAIELGEVLYAHPVERFLDRIAGLWPDGPTF